VNFLESFLVSQSTNSVLEDFVVAGLASTGWTNDHKTMSNKDGVVELVDLLDEKRDFLDVEMFARF
jgi:hypothetical protein